MSENTPHPHPDGPATKREVKLREGPDERVWVEWYVRDDTATFCAIVSEESGDELIILTAMPNEFDQLLRVLRDVTGTGLISQKSMFRDLGDFERVWAERSDGFVTLIVEKFDGIDRMLILDENEAERLTDAVERAIDEMPGTEDEAHV